jgi:hypothetical protein
LLLLLLAIEFVQATTQVFCFTPQLFLLPALLLRLLRLVLLLLRQFLLPFRQFLELADGFAEFLLGVLLRELRFALVLALLDIHFQFEHLGEIARGLRALAATVLLHRHLHFAECGFGAQQLL